MRWFPLLWAAATLFAQSGDNVLLVVNDADPASREIADYYRTRRSIPVRNVCRLSTTTEEEINWTAYEQGIERPIGPDGPPLKVPDVHSQHSRLK